MIKILGKIDFKDIFLISPRRDSYDHQGRITFLEVAFSRILHTPANGFMGAFAFLLEQLTVTLTFLRINKRINFIIFYHCSMPLPLLLSRILRKDSLVYTGGVTLSSHPQAVLSWKINCVLDYLHYRWSGASSSLHLDWLRWILC